MAGHRRTAGVSRFLISATIASLALAFGFSSGVAQAAGASTKVEQGWELLNQQISNQAVSTSIAIARGPLVGTFTPTPTAAFEVTGKVVGGTSGTWTVALLDATGTTLASTAFIHGADANFNLHAPSISTLSDAASISLTSSGTNPGALSINKAYVRFKQNGVVQGTDAHVSMVGTQMGITTSTSSLVASPTLYKHVAADFTPAPTVKLRVSGNAGPKTSLDVRLIKCASSGTPPVINCNSGAFVGGVTFSNSGTVTGTPTSIETGSLTLTDDTYAVWASVASISGNGPQQGPGLSATGDLISADLELRQSTTNGRGIEKTVSWSQSVSYAVTAPPTGETHFLFDAPVVQAPACSTPLWLTTVSSATGASTMSGDMRDTSAASTLTAATPYTGTSVGAQQVSPSTLPSTGAVLDTTIASGSAGTITWSALRYALCLWDGVNPTITNFTASRSAFNPYANTTVFSATLADDYQFGSWTLSINRHSDGVTVKSFTSPSPTFSQPWDGKDSNGAWVQGGAYDGVLTVADTSANSVTQTIGVTVAFPPVVANLLPSVTPFSPGVSIGTKDTTTFTASITGDAPPFSWTLAIKNASGSTVRSFGPDTTTSVSQLWDGKNSSNAFVSSGNYSATLSVTDAIGSITTSTTSIVVDRVAPVMTSVPTSYMSGTGNGNHTTMIQPVVTEVSLPVTYSATITDGANNVVRTLSGQTLSWDGKDALNTLQSDGTYTITLTATDTQNLTSASATGSIVIDSVSPTISNYAIDNPYFSPNADGVKDGIQATATISDAHLGTWAYWVYRGTTGLNEGCGNCNFYPPHFQWDGGVWNYQNGSYVRVIQPDGAYSLKLTATDLAGNNATQSLDATVDKVAPVFSANPSLSNRYFSPNADGVRDTTVVSATTTDANNLGSWVVQFKNAVSPYTLRQSIAGTGLAVAGEWDGVDSTGSPVQEGAYIVSVAVTDAAGNSTTRFSPVNAVVDVTKPFVKRLLPEDGSNSQFLSQPVGAELSDLSGIQTDGATISLNGLAASGFSARAGSSWYESDPQSLVSGQGYSASLSVSDLAGNLLSRSWQFKSISPLVAEPATATLDAIGINTHASGATPGTERWTFDPMLVIADRAVHLPQGSKHPGWGTWASTVPLAGARVQIAGADWPVPLFSAEDTRTVYQQLSYGGTQEQALDSTVGALRARMPQVAIDLPVGTPAASSHYEVSTTGSLAGTCADPSASASACSPDPIRFFLNRDWVSHLPTRITTGEAGAAPSTAVFGILRLVPDPLVPLRSVWHEFWPYEALPCTGVTPAWCSYGGVIYESTNMGTPPVLWDNQCQVAPRFCRMLSTDGGLIPGEGGSTSPSQRSKQNCINLNDGRPTTSPDWIPYCEQSYTTYGELQETITGRTGKKLYHFNAAAFTEWGVYNYGDLNLSISLGTYSQKVKWAVAAQADMPSNLMPPVSGVWDAQGGCEDGVYPQGGDSCDPLLGEQIAAKQAYYCYLASPSNVAISGTARRVTHPDDGVEDFGVGLDSAPAIADGLRDINCGGYHANSIIPSYVRMDAYVYESHTCGSACKGHTKEGNLRVNFGYTYSEVDWGTTFWKFAENVIVSCGTSPTDCWSPYGIAWTVGVSYAQSESTTERTKVISYSKENAFSYT